MEASIREISGAEAQTVSTQEMDTYLQTLGLADAQVRGCLMQEVMLASLEKRKTPTTSDMRRHLAGRAAEAMGRESPQDVYEEADAILAFVMSGALRRYSRALLQPYSDDATRVRRMVSHEPVILPYEQTGSMPVQSLQSTPLFTYLAAAWHALTRAVTALGGRTPRCP